jgi:exodeoxyribonuclease V alpha subunit
MSIFYTSVDPIDKRLLTTDQPIAMLIKSIEWGVKEGHLRHLDLALVRFFYDLEHKLDVHSLLPLLWMVVVLSQYQAQGHTCVSLKLVLSKEIELFKDHQVQKNVFLQSHYAPLLESLPNSLKSWRDCLLASSLVCMDNASSFEPVKQHSEPRSNLDDKVDHAKSIVLLDLERDVLVYFRRQWVAEDFIATALYKKSKMSWPVDEKLVSKALCVLFDASDEVARGQGAQDLKELDWQKIACAMSVRSPLSIITGGPGTGKTYTVARLIALACMLNTTGRPLRISLSAPTGKAASRLYRSIETSLMSLSHVLHSHLDCRALLEQIGSAKTLHTLLGFRMHEKSFHFNEHQLLPLDVLVMDEGSMIDAELMSALLRALSPSTTLILLGDKDQLSSVEAGSILSELSGHLKSTGVNNLSDLYDEKSVDFLCEVTGLSKEEHAPSSTQPRRSMLNLVMLTKSRRFEGHIAELAQAINLGDISQVNRLLIKARESDIACTTSFKMGPLLEVCLGLGHQGLQKGQSADLFTPNSKINFLSYLKVFERNGALSRRANPRTSLPVETWIVQALVEFERFRVLCAINEGPLGAIAINQAIERQLQSEGWIEPGSEWYSGRAILLTRNQHDLGLSNGDVGLVVRDPVDGVFRAYFLAGSGFQSVSINRLLSVQTAYAMSIHKAQGSEYEHAMVVLQDHAEKSLTRELLYTGVTRAKRFLSIFQAQPSLVERAVSTRAKRTSGLSQRLLRLSQM